MLISEGREWPACWPVSGRGTASGRPVDHVPCRALGAGCRALGVWRLVLVRLVVPSAVPGVPGRPDNAEDMAYPEDPVPPRGSGAYLGTITTRPCPAKWDQPGSGRHPAMIAGQNTPPHGCFGPRSWMRPCGDGRLPVIQAMPSRNTPQSLNSPPDQPHNPNQPHCPGDWIPRWPHESH